MIILKKYSKILHILLTINQCYSFSLTNILEELMLITSGGIKRLKIGYLNKMYYAQEGVLEKQLKGENIAIVRNQDDA